MVFRFGQFQLDITERRLLRESEIIPLRSKVFDTLAILVENHGRLVRKDELMQRLWPDGVVEENNLDHNISKLRRALGKTNGDKFMKPCPGRGTASSPRCGALGRGAFLSCSHCRRTWMFPIRKSASSRPRTVFASL